MLKAISCVLGAGLVAATATICSAQTSPVTDPSSALAARGANVEIVRRVKPDRELVREALRDRGLDLTSVRPYKSKGVRWREDSREGRLFAHRRISASAVDVGAEFFDLDYYQQKRGPVDEGRLVQKATALVDSLCDAGVLSCGDVQLVVQKVDYLHFQGSGTDQVTHALELAARVVFLPYLGGLPIFGSRAQGQIVFDPDAEVMEIDLPVSNYRRVLRAKRGGLALASVGLDATPARIGQRMRYRGATRQVEQLECGFMDDETTPGIVPGCRVRFAPENAEAGPSEVFVPAEN